MEEQKVFYILIVDDTRADDSLIKRLLSESQEKQLYFCRVSTYADAAWMLRQEDWDAILVNQVFDNHPGLELIHHIRLLDRCIPVILLSDHYDYQLEYKARKVGATDYYEKRDLTAPELFLKLRTPRPKGPSSAADNKESFPTKHPVGRYGRQLE